MNPAHKSSIHPSEWLITHPSLDLAFTTALGVVVGIAKVSHGHDPLSTLSVAERGVAYQTIATAAAALLGFGITAMAIFVALVPGARIRRLMERRGIQVRTIFSSTIWVLAVLIAVSVLGAIADGAAHGTIVRTLTYGALILSAIRVARLLWLFTNLVSIATRDRDENTGNPAETPANLL